MRLDQFIKDFSAEFNETAESMFNANTCIKDLDEWHSVLSLSIISMIDENANIRVSGNELRSCSTIQELFQAINKA